TQQYCRSRKESEAAESQEGTWQATLDVLIAPPRSVSLAVLPLTLQGSAPGRPPASGFRLLPNHLAAAIHAGLQVDMVRPAQFAGILVFDIGRRLQRIRRPAHAAPRRRCFSLRHGHSGVLLRIQGSTEGGLIEEGRA